MDSSGKCALSGPTEQSIFSFMQRHDFQFEESNIPETINLLCDVLEYCLRMLTLEAAAFLIHLSRSLSDRTD